MRQLIIENSASINLRLDWTQKDAEAEHAGGWEEELVNYK